MGSGKGNGAPTRSVGRPPWQFPFSVSVFATWRSGETSTLRHRFVPRRTDPGELAVTGGTYVSDMHLDRVRLPSLSRFVHIQFTANSPEFRSGFPQPGAS
jgi:hypothetical protein